MCRESSFEVVLLVFHFHPFPVSTSAARAGKERSGPWHHGNTGNCSSAPLGIDDIGGFRTSLRAETLEISLSHHSLKQNQGTKMIWQNTAMYIFYVKIYISNLLTTLPQKDPRIFIWSPKRWLFGETFCPESVTAFTASPVNRLGSASDLRLRQC